MIRKLDNQWIDKPNRSFYLSPLIQAVSILAPTEPEQGYGDCIETDIPPELIRQHFKDKLIIRRHTLNTWRIWKIL